MAVEWPILTLREAKVSLIDCDHRTPPATDTGYPYVAIPQIRDGRIDFTDARRISPEHFAEWTRKALPRANDIVLSRRCNPGETAVAPPDTKFALGQNLVLLRTDGTRVNPSFLRWLVRGPEWWEQIGKFLNVGAVFDSLRCADVPKFELSIPPLPEQRAIAHILDTLDEKIQLNRRISETLEAMARALFKSWFVDFDPVRAKVEGRDPVFAGEITDLFPKRFTASASGEIPEGWEIASLGDHFDAVRGLSYKGAGLSGAGVPLHNLNSLYEGGGYKHEGIKFYKGEHAERHRVSAGDVIVANTEQGHDRLLVGYAAIVPTHFGDRSIASHHLYRMRPKPASPLSTSFLANLLNSTRMHNIVSGYANGTTVNMLPLDGVQKPLFCHPPRQLVETFTALASHTERRREQLVAESQTLSRIRDMLLPRLLSGDLRVQGAENLLTGLI